MDWLNEEWVKATRDEASKAWWAKTGDAWIATGCGGKGTTGLIGMGCEHDLFVDDYIARAAAREVVEWLVKNNNDFSLALAENGEYDRVVLHGGLELVKADWDKLKQEVA